MLDEFMSLLVTELDLAAVPSSRGTSTGAALTWELYQFEVSIPDLGPEELMLDLALAEQGSVVYAVALLTLPADYDPHRALYKTVFRYVSHALAPLE
jgi:hypothetical protein